MSMFVIEPYANQYNAWADKFIQEAWGSTVMVSRGVRYQVLDYPGFVAVLNGEPRGIVTFYITADACEVLLLHSDAEGMGIGSGLIQQVKQKAQQSNCKRLWLITANDSIHAI